MFVDGLPIYCMYGLSVALFFLNTLVVEHVLLSIADTLISFPEFIEYF